MTPLNTSLLTILLVLVIAIILFPIAVTVLYWTAVLLIALVDGIIKIFKWIWRKLTRR